MHIHAIVGAALDTEHYGNDAYVVYGCLPVNKRRVSKGGAMNRNKG